jgi:hypothetical protein
LRARAGSSWRGTARRAIDHRLGSLETGVEENRREDRLEGVGQDGRAAVTAALHLALAQAQVFTELQAVGQAVQGFLAHEVGPQAGHVALAQLAETLEQGDGGDAVDDAVAEKLQPLVVGRTEAAMGDRLLEQLRREKRWPMAFCRASSFMRFA